MTKTLATYTALAALAFAPSVALAQSAAPSTTTPPAATQTAPDAASPNAPASTMPGSTGATAATTTVPATPTFISAQTGTQWLGSNIIGTDVVTSSDEKLGSISDLIVERDGSVVAAVIDVGGFLGIGAKPVAVSFKSLTATPTQNGEKIVVALTKEELNSAPEFKTLEQTNQASTVKTQ